MVLSFTDVDFSNSNFTLELSTQSLPLFVEINASRAVSFVKIDNERIS
jgi:hypothetical protein